MFDLNLNTARGCTLRRLILRPRAHFPTVHSTEISECSRFHHHSFVTCHFCSEAKIPSTFIFNFLGFLANQRNNIIVFLLVLSKILSFISAFIFIWLLCLFTHNHLNLKCVCVYITHAPTVFASFLLTVHLLSVSGLRHFCFSSFSLLKMRWVVVI